MEQFITSLDTVLYNNTNDILEREGRELSSRRRKFEAMQTSTSVGA